MSGAPTRSGSLSCRAPARCFASAAGASSSKPIKVVLINGSVRPGNYTSMATSLVADELRKDPRIEALVVNPGELKLAMPGLAPTEDAKKLQHMVKNAAAVVLATPEYHGSYSSVIKLAIENLGFPSVLAGKPIALVGVAAGAIGAIKSLESLRGVVSHVGAIPLPLAVSIPNVQKIFNADGKCQEPQFEALLRGVSKSVKDYLEHSVCPAITLEKLTREGPASVTAHRAPTGKV